VQKNASYSGNAPRLVLRRQDSMGVTADTVLATFAGSSGTWVNMVGNSPAAPQDGIFEFYIDCDNNSLSNSAAIYVDGVVLSAA
jgi:hypothetical protein